MSLLAALAISAIIDYCPWADRGLDRFGGDLVASVDNYVDIPTDVRRKLQSKMALRKYDDLTHLSAAGNSSATWNYGPPTMMHFGTKGVVCRTVDTRMWKETDRGERGLVYCVEGHCVVVWTVCRNLSKIKRLGPVAIPSGTPPSPTRAAAPPAVVDPLPVAADAPVPPVEPGPVADALPPMSFAQQTVPPYSPPPVDEYPERISADQPWNEYRSWRLLPPVASYFALADATLPVTTGSSTVGPFVPVPGITPSSALPDPTPVQPAPVKPVTPEGAPVPGNVAPIPEASTLVMMSLGLLGVLFVTRRRV